MLKFLFFILFVSVVVALPAQVKNNYALISKGNVLQPANTAFYQSNKMNYYDIKYLKLDITAQPQSTFIKGICSYKVIVTQPLDTFAIEFKQTMNVDSVLINNNKQTFTRSNDHIYIPLNPVATAGTELNLQFFYNGNVAAGIYAGLDVSTGLQYTATVSESFEAREWFPAKQMLNDKIDSTDTWITTGASFKGGSNGLLKQVLDLPGNLKQYRWSCHYPLSYYMPNFAVANYMEYDNYAKPASIAPDSILIQNYLVNNPTYFADNKYLLDKTPKYIEKMSELFGLYPFYKEKYGHVQANIGGGMEHATMTTLQNFDEKLVAHELTHQWFGDNVTCATWNDIWLNESFATYGHILMEEKIPALFPVTEADEIKALHENIMLSPGGSVYVPLADSYNESRIFDGRLSYNKGAAVLHTLRFQMQSDTLFFNTLKTYQQKFKDGFATTTDFKAVAEQVTGKDLADFFNEWIYGEGYPTYSVTYSKQGNDTLVLNIVETTSMPAITPLFKGLMEYKISSTTGDTIVKLNQTANTQAFKIPYTKTPTNIEIDPNNWVINGVGSVVTGVTNLTPAEAGVKIYPNPATALVYIQLGTLPFDTAELIDANGHVVTVIALPRTLATYTMPLHATKGMYFIRLTGRKGNVTEEIFVDK